MVYRPELDGLRALAVAVVVLFHADNNGPFSGGFVGVDLFFVLSGFLITSILAREFENKGAIDLRHFYLRRFQRLTPALLLFLCAYLVAAPFIWPSHPHTRDAIFAALYLSDYTFALWRAPQYIAHTWSLAVEEHFYLLWPLILPLIIKARRPLVWLVAVWLVATLWRTTNYDSLMASYRFDTRASGLVLGAALYFVRKEISVALTLTGLVLFSTVVLIAKLEMTIIAVPLAELASALMVLGAANLSFLSHASLVSIGKLSYGIYLWHFPIALAVQDDLSFLPAAAVIWTASIALAAVSYFTVEYWARSKRYKAALST